MSRRAPPPIPRDGKPDPDFLEQLLQCEEEARDLREKIATLMHLAPKDPAAWFATFTDPAVCKGLGSLMMTTGKSGVWIDNAVSDAMKVLNSQLPQAEVLGLMEHFVEGQIDAEVCCTCGDCVPCAYRNEHGAPATREHLGQQLRPKVKKGAVLFGADGRPLH